MSNSLFQRFGTNRFQTQFEELQEKYNKLQKQSDDKSNEINALNDKITELNAQCESKNDIIGILDSRIENYLSEIKSLKDKSNDHDVAHRLVKDENQRLKTDLHDLVEERDLLLSKLEKQNTTISSFNEKYQRLENRFTQQLDKNDDLGRKMLEQQMELTHCKTLLGSISEELQLIKRKFDIV